MTTGIRNKSIVYILLASSAAIANSFIFDYDNESRRHRRFDRSTPSYFRVVTAESSASPTALSVFSENNMKSKDDGDKNMDFAEGYEYVHPDIAAMLLTKASNSNDGPRPFVVDSDTLTLQRGPKREDDFEISTTDTMPVDLLAGLADECDHVVFTGTAHDGRISKKIHGLMCLSQLSTTTSRPKKSLQGQSSDMQTSAIVVANMVALNLLESSIRSIVMTSRRTNNKADADRGNNKSNNHNAKRHKNNTTESKSTKGAPLLSLLIQEMSSLDHIIISLDPTTPSPPPKTTTTTTSGPLPPRTAFLTAPDLGPILRALLLPTKVGGINIRNLVSHGFLSTIERRWLSLTLVLIQTMDSLLLSHGMPINENEKGVCDDVDRSKRERDAALSTAAADQEHGTSSLTKYSPMTREVHYGKNITLSFLTLQELKLRSDGFVPSSHVQLLRFALDLLAPTIQQTLHSTTQEDESTKYAISLDQKHHDSITAQSAPPLTAIFTTVMCSLLEHSLRILWCQVNNRPDDCFARPSEYYVTLDGHGQRFKHEVMILPYLSDEKTRNELIRVIGAEPCALLSDLFAAPSAEAPNIRSAVCHGSWDGELVNELEGLGATSKTSSDDSRKSDPLLVDAAFALVSCLDMITSNLSGKTRISIYRPVYTYTAMATRSLDRFVRDLAELDALVSTNFSIANCIKTMELQQPKLCGDLRPLKIDLKALKEMAYDLFPTMEKGDDENWIVEDTFSEHQTNLALASNIVVLTLLADASDAIKKYLDGVQERIDVLSMHPSSTKDRRILKTTTRFCSAAMIVRDFYTFTVYVALVTMKDHSQNELRNDGGSPYDATKKKFDREDIVRASERSRMTLSTFDSHIGNNLDRSLKALQQYLQGKAVKKVLLAK